MKKILLSIALLCVALPANASTFEGEIQGCAIEKYQPTQEIIQALDYAYGLLDELVKFDNPIWEETLSSIRSQLDCIRHNFIN